jgi:hypothetical protein
MCKTCGCAAGTQQLRFQVKGNEQPIELQTLYTDLIGAPGVLQVTTDEKSGQLAVDFNPQRTSQQELEQRLTGLGYTIDNVELRAPAHHHSISGFFKRILGQ